MRASIPNWLAVVSAAYRDSEAPALLPLERLLRLPERSATTHVAAELAHAAAAADAPESARETAALAEAVEAALSTYGPTFAARPATLANAASLRPGRYSRVVHQPVLGPQVPP